MSNYTQILVDSALENKCPGCGPTLKDLSADSKGFISRYCACCGWTIMIHLDDSDQVIEVLFGSMPPDVDYLDRFNCFMEHPEHRTLWPQPERDDDQPDPYDTLELTQQVFTQDQNHPYLTRPEEKCGNCGKWAPHKIAEEKLDFYGHPYAAAICCDCFEKIFGYQAHRYDKVTQPVIIEEL